MVILNLHLKVLNLLSNYMLKLFKIIIGLKFIYLRTKIDSLTLTMEELLDLTVTEEKIQN